MLTEIQTPCDESSPAEHEARSDRNGDGNLDRVTVWGLPLARLTYRQTLDEVDCLIRRGEPAFFITANLNYAMLARRDERMRSVNDRAAFLLADGMPLVWYSRLLGKPLPERVAGADLISMLAERAAERAYRVFLLGGAGDVAEQVAGTFGRRYPGVRIVGVEAPMIDDLSEQQHEGLIARIRQARPDLLLVAFGQPKGELWLAENYQALGVPACVQLGASFDFVVGRTSRAPRWMQRTGLEWLHRIGCEPRRMIPRYLRNAAFLVTAIARDLVSVFWKRR
ncbi:MAG: WecB/TagA/CpsF family glycosyltransferase [Planctomycetota bacterium]|jgi:N-acetylglucosaminyldiphosphoundecaprenol N-acetyl-beta-D-mannosaminyltransferase